MLGNLNLQALTAPAAPKWCPPDLVGARILPELSSGRKCLLPHPGRQRPGAMGLLNYALCLSRCRAKETHVRLPSLGGEFGYDSRGYHQLHSSHGPNPPPTPFSTLPSSQQQVTADQCWKSTSFLASCAVLKLSAYWPGPSDWPLLSGCSEQSHSGLGSECLKDWHWLFWLYYWHCLGWVIM